MATGDLLEWIQPSGLSGRGRVRQGLALDGRNDEALTYGTENGRSIGIVSKIPDNLSVRTVSRAGEFTAVRFADDVRGGAPRSAAAALAANPTTSPYSNYNGPQPELDARGRLTRPSAGPSGRTASTPSTSGTGNS